MHVARQTQLRILSIEDVHEGTDLKIDPPRSTEDVGAGIEHNDEARGTNVKIRGERGTKSLSFSAERQSRRLRGCSGYSS